VKFYNFFSQELMSLSHQRLRLIHRRTVWRPTRLGTICIALFFMIPLIWWCLFGESFLSVTERSPANVLVVEGWIGRDGVRAAAAEFRQYGYEFIVATGGLTAAVRWEEGGWSYAEGAEHELVRSGVPQDRIIVAHARDTETQRTYESATAVCQALQARGIRPKAMNVFTYGTHARRSRLVFAKTEEPETEVGIVSWVPSSYKTGPWWRSSDRAKELLTETAGYLFEVFLNSGRDVDSSGKNVSPRLNQHLATRVTP
jgi:uncharacterized SAM-binding protein YcdF (DUF218 family)